MPRCSRQKTTSTLSDKLARRPLRALALVALLGSALPAAAADTQAPTVPTGVKATASVNGIALSWNASTDNVGVKGYRIYVNGSELAVTTKTSYYHGGRTPGATYQYRVRAYDATPNYSAMSPAVSATMPGTTASKSTQSTTTTSGAASATFSSTTADFPNPERGLSRMATNLAGLSSSWLTSHRDAGYRMVTHRQDLSAYVKTATLPKSFLDALNAGAELHRKVGTKMAMQFSYDNKGGGPEPTLSIIKGHIAQLKPFFEANADVIAVVHAGFLGTYGEWAFSKEPSIGSPTPSAAARAAVRDALFAAVPKSIPIAWRNLSDLKAWYPTPLTSAQAFTGTNQARSGIHNDCFLSNKDDSGTYWAAGVSDTGRTLSNPFRAYHAKISEWTTTGGENCSGGQYTACADALNDGRTYHWAYLRDDWGTSYHTGWKSQGCYAEIRRSLGYRFQLDAISHAKSASAGGKLNVTVDMRNVGWARIKSDRQLVVTLQNRSTGARITGRAGDMRTLPSQATSSSKVVVAVSIPATAAAGTYDVYLSMPDIGTRTKDKPEFAVRFANADNSSKGQAWEAANFRFKTGTSVSITK